LRHKTTASPHVFSLRSFLGLPYLDFRASAVDWFCAPIGESAIYQGGDLVKIVVALFNIDTQALQYMSADQRVREVSNAVERARDYTSSQGTF
jgi:hypothetical protein